MSAESAGKLFSKMVISLTFDPGLDTKNPANTDLHQSGTLKPVSLGRSFFNLSLMDNSLLDEFDLAGIKVDGSVFATGLQQRAFILLHEFKHAVTGKAHSSEAEYKDWLQGVYDNCFKPK